MRKVVLQMMSSLDGRVDQPFAWIDGVSEDLYSEIERLYAAFDTVLVGRVTYGEMLEYWPGAETDAAGTDTNRRMARRINACKKYVFSRQHQETPLAWNNSSLVTTRDDQALVGFVRELKAQPGGEIHLSGGAGLARTFVRLDLVDEYRFFVHPVASPGVRWFEDVRERRALELLRATPYPCGVVGLYYRPAALAGSAQPRHFAELLR